MAKILWIEDDKEVIDATKIILEREGWEIHVAYSADEGTDLAGKIEPDLIICDIIMDEKHGFDGIKDLKKNPKLSGIPIVIYSGVADRWAKSTASLRKGVKTGADLFIDKGEGVNVLIDTIKECLKK